MKAWHGPYSRGDGLNVDRETVMDLQAENNKTDLILSQ